MKNAIILQGAGETQESFWLPYIKRELEERGYEVWLPQLPGNDDPDVSRTLPFVLENGRFGEETIIITHSAGGPLALAVLEKVSVKVRKVIIVAGYCSPLPDGANKSLRESYDWGKIRENSKFFVFINSDDDPWGCDDTEGRKMFDKLGGTLVIQHGEGHMGSDKFNQPYKEFPFLLKFLD